MRGDEIRDARDKLGEMWELDRPLRMSELGRALRLRSRDVGATVHDWERGKSTISGPVSVAIEMMLAGAMPPDSLDEIIKYK